MAEKKSGCGKKLFIGCGCMTFFIMGMAVGLPILSIIFGPDGRESISFGLYDEISVEMKENLLNGDKPIHLAIRMEGTDFKLEPAKLGEGISIDGFYDKKNYSVEVSSREHEDHLQIEVNLTKKSGIKFYVAGTDNNMKVNLPLGRELFVDLETENNENHFNFSGLTLGQLDLKLERGFSMVKVERRNIRTMEQMHINLNLGSTKFKGLGKLRAKKTRIDLTMAELHVKSSGTFENESEIVLYGNGGEAVFILPYENRVSPTVHANIVPYNGPNTPFGEEGGPSLKFDGILNLTNLIISREPKRRSLIEEMNRVYLDKGISEAISQYRYLAENDPNSFLITSHGLLGFGYRLLDEEKADDALPVFLLHMEYFPDDAKSYQALSVGYLALGVFESALEEINKAEEKEPGNVRTLELKRKIETLLKEKEED